MTKTRTTKIKAKQTKNPTILPKKAMASSLLCSKNSLSGSEKNRKAMTATEVTRRQSMTIGMIMVSLGSIEPVKFTTRTIETIYKAAARA